MPYQGTVVGGAVPGGEDRQQLLGDEAGKGGASAGDLLELGAVSTIRREPGCVVPRPPPAVRIAIVRIGVADGSDDHLRQTVAIGQMVDDALCDRKRIIGVEHYEERIPFL